MNIQRTCCMSNKYGWCEDQDAQIKVDGKRYCIFHAPADHKAINGKPIRAEEFNALVFKRIDSVILLGDKAKEIRPKNRFAKKSPWTSRESCFLAMLHSLTMV